MTQQDVRAAVEAAIRRHLDERTGAPSAAGRRPVALPVSGGPAHGRLVRVALSGDPPDGRCVIEPSVECTGCGYCESHGH